jgi:3-hydroxyanthranilate 3,4-dioxygenase
VDRGKSDTYYNHLLNNTVLYKDSDFIVMIIGGPNARKDFHFNEGEEFFINLKEI